MESCGASLSGGVKLPMAPVAGWWASSFPWEAWWLQSSWEAWWLESSSVGGGGVGAPGPSSGVGGDEDELLGVPGVAPFTSKLGPVDGEARNDDEPVDLDLLDLSPETSTFMAIL